VKAKVRPVIIGATGTISESLRQYLNNIPREHEIQEPQKTDILGTARTLQSANVKVQNIVSRKITLQVNTEQLQHYIP
jgi:hypothetical protein